MTKISNLPTGTELVSTDEFAIARAGTSRKIAASGLVWEKIIDLPLTVSTNWTLPAGWSTDGTKFIYGGTATTRARYLPRVQQDCFIAECKAWIPASTRTAGTQRIGLLVNWDGVNTGASFYAIQWGNNVIGAATAYTERDGVAAGPQTAISPAIGFDAWHTIRVCRSGMAASLLINGVSHLTTRIDSHAAADKDQSYIGLVGLGCDVWVKDFKVWRLRQPV